MVDQNLPLEGTVVHITRRRLYGSVLPYGVNCKVTCTKVYELGVIVENTLCIIYRSPWFRLYS